jgi:hypothetical protein
MIRVIRALVSRKSSCVGTHFSRISFWMDVDLLLYGTSIFDKQEVTTAYADLKVSALPHFTILPDITALDNFDNETSSACSLLKFELIDSRHCLSNSCTEGDVSGVTIHSVCFQ